MTHAEFISELKALILSATEKPPPDGGLTDDEVLFGPESRLALDSLDGLQISMAVQERFGVRMTDSKETRRALGSIDCLAKYLVVRMP